MSLRDRFSHFMRSLLTYLLIYLSVFLIIFSLSFYIFLTIMDEASSDYHFRDDKDLLRHLPAITD